MSIYKYSLHDAVIQKRRKFHTNAFVSLHVEKFNIEEGAVYDDKRATTGSVAAQCRSVSRPGSFDAYGYEIGRE